jgi:hypothetical protein
MRAFALFAVAVVVAACSPSPQCSGGSDCGTPDAAPCSACAPLATGLCVDGTCHVRGKDNTDVTATVSVDRHLTVQGFAYALAPATTTCAALGSFTSFPSSISALASGQITFDGGPFHDNVGLGRIPGGDDVLLLGLGTDQAAAKGNVIAHGCAQANVEPPAVAFTLNLGP